MDARCALYLTTTRFECGMRRLDLQSAGLSRGTLPRCCPLLTLPMGATLSPDLETRFECGMRRLDLQLASLSRGTFSRCCPLLTLPMGATLSPDPQPTRFDC